MKLKDKVKSYSFWISLGSAIILILNLIGNKFGFNIDSGFASDLLTSLCSILVLLGIIVTPTSITLNSSQKENLPIFKDEENNQEENIVYEVGNSINHKKYGKGTVVKTIKYENRQLLQIEFEQAGKKLLDPKVADIELE